MGYPFLLCLLPDILPEQHQAIHFKISDFNFPGSLSDIKRFSKYDSRTPVFPLTLNFSVSEFVRQYSTLNFLSNSSQCDWLSEITEIGSFSLRK